MVIQKKSHIPGVKIQNIIYELPFVKFLSEHSYFYSLMFNNTWEFFKTRLARRAAEQVNEYAIAIAYPTEACHAFHVKAATQTTAKLPPIGA